jgi:hypothetical protein
MRYGYLIGGFLVWIALGSPFSEAQYTANFQTNSIIGVTNNWSGSYIVGSNTFADTLLIENSGVLSNGDVYLGYGGCDSNNSVLVTQYGFHQSRARDFP